MIYRFRTSDHPNANGRDADDGEYKFILEFPLEEAGAKLRVEIGERGRRTLLKALRELAPGRHEE